MIRPAMTLAFLLPVVVACSGSASAPGDGATAGDGESPKASGNAPTEPAAGADGSGAAPSPASSQTAPLSCSSLTFCTSHEVARYEGERIPAATGGELKDGLYRLSYTLRADGKAGTVSSSSATALVVRGRRYLRVGFGPDDVGTLATNGTKLTLTPETNCDSETGATLSASSSVVSRGFSVDGAGRLTLINDEYALADVYVPASSACASPMPVPKTPGDSVNCNVTNCGCAEAVGKAADKSTCDFVSGG